MKYTVEQLDAMPVGTVLKREHFTLTKTQMSCPACYSGGGLWHVDEGNGWQTEAHGYTLADTDFTHRAEPTPLEAANG